MAAPVPTAPPFIVADTPAPIPPAIDGARRRRELDAALRRIDGWGPRAWREVGGAWDLGPALIAVGPTIADPDDDPLLPTLAVDLVVPRHGLGRVDGPAAAAALCDWVLRRAWATLLAAPPVRVTTLRPGTVIRATNACYLLPAVDGVAPVCLRLRVRPPMAGMCCDAKPYRAFLRRLVAFAAGLQTGRPQPGRRAHLRAVAVQQALRAALPAHGLVAFLGNGARLARARGGGPDPACRPLAVAKARATTIDLGRLGRVSGLGIRAGITAIAGAPYHGKSTVLAALAAGREDHPPGDGRELVVADASAVAVPADDGRRIKAQDVAGFFAALPGSDSRAFTTNRASGATSMAAGVLQAVAAGSRLLLIDEDTAASNFLAIDAGMRRLLGRTLHGTRTLIEVLPALARAGTSTVLVAGSTLAALAVADRVLELAHFQPRDATARVRRLAGAPPRPARAWRVPARVLDDHPDRLLGPRHFLAVAGGEAERPLVGDEVLDLRRCGWELDPALARGACAAAAWCLRLAGGRPVDLDGLGRTYQAWISRHGPGVLDPYHIGLHSVPPWQLVVAVLERLEHPHLHCLPA
jgi:predicted ABC-class ATPase